MNFQHQFINNEEKNIEFDYEKKKVSINVKNLSAFWSAKVFAETNESIIKNITF